MTTFDATVDLIQARPGQQVVLLIERDGETFETTTTLEDHNPEGEPGGLPRRRPDAIPYESQSILVRRQEHRRRCSRS